MPALILAEYLTDGVHFKCLLEKVSEFVYYSAALNMFP